MSTKPEPSPQREAPPSSATRLLGSSVGFAFAVALALGAAHWYEQPHLRGSVSHSVLVEPDFLCSLASAAVAVVVGATSSRAATRPGAIASGSPLVRGVLWAGLTLSFLLVWVDSIRLFTLLVAPAHGFAALRVIGLWSKWRADAAWSRRD